jgi:hypothetical protein
MPWQNFVAGERPAIPDDRRPHSKREGNYDPLLPWTGVQRAPVERLAEARISASAEPPAQRLWTANARTMDFESPDYAQLATGATRRARARLR